MKTYRLNLKEVMQKARIAGRLAKGRAFLAVTASAIGQANRSEIAKLAEKLTIRAQIRQAFTNLSQKRS